jgi:hypothetical protein
MRTPTCFNDRLAEKADDPGSVGRDHHFRPLDRGNAATMFAAFSAIV